MPTTTQRRLAATEHRRPPRDLAGEMVQWLTAANTFSIEPDCGAAHTGTVVPVELTVDSPVAVVPSTIFVGTIAAKRRASAQVSLIPAAQMAAVDPETVIVRHDLGEVLQARLLRESGNRLKLMVVLNPCKPGFLRGTITLDFGRSPAGELKIPVMAKVTDGEG